MNFYWFHLYFIMTKRVPLKIQAKIHQLHQNGQKVKELAEEFKVSQITIHCILKEGRKRPKKGGRPTKLSKQEHLQLLQYCDCNPMASAKSIAEATGLPVSKETV